MLWYVFPGNSGISWEGHLSGFFVGLVFAFYFKSNPLQNKKFDWEREDYNPENDAFLRQFDEKGNFVELPKDEVPEEVLSEKIVNEDANRIKITYTIKKNSENKEG
jgi:hypothetical protein